MPEQRARQRQFTLDIEFIVYYTYIDNIKPYKYIVESHAHAMVLCVCVCAWNSTRSSARTPNRKSARATDVTGTASRTPLARLITTIIHWV